MTDLIDLLWRITGWKLEGYILQPIGKHFPSPEFMKTVAEKLSKAIPKAQYRSLDGQNHGVKPDVIAPILIDFFK